MLYLTKAEKPENEAGWEPENEAGWEPGNEAGWEPGNETEKNSGPPYPLSPLFRPPFSYSGLCLLHLFAAVLRQ